MCSTIVGKLVESKEGFLYSMNYICLLWHCMAFWFEYVNFLEVRVQIYVEVCHFNIRPPWATKATSYIYLVSFWLFFFWLDTEGKQFLTLYMFDFPSAPSWLRCKRAPSLKFIHALGGPGLHLPCDALVLLVVSLILM